MQADRAPVSVVMPFLGSEPEARAALDAVALLELRGDDEILVADNTGEGVVARAAAAWSGAPLRALTAQAERSAYYARNVAAEAAANEWLLFVDADCRPPATLADDHLNPAPRETVGAQAGPIVPARGQDSLLARWAAARQVLSQERSLELPGGPAAATANLLVRRAAWAQIGGFLEGASLGTEFEFCWRLVDAGWEIGWRPAAAVEHLHRETLRGVLRQFSMYAAGDAWLNRRRPGAVPRPRIARPLARAAAGIVGFAAIGQFDRARMKAIDGAVVVAQATGYRRGNAAPRHVASAPRASGIVVATDYFPVLTEQFVTREIEALIRAGRRVRVEAVARPERPLEGGARGLEVSWLEDEGTFDRLFALVRLLTRHPLRSLGDLRERRRFDPQERMPLRALAPAALRLIRRRDVHVHVHFAALAAADMLRVGRIARVPVSITPHAHEIYSEARALPAKLARVAFVSTVCAYNVEHLRAIAPREARERIHNVPLGLDARRIRRSSPPAAGRVVAAVGRLVPQKGFAHLVEAAAELERSEPLERVLIVGAGPQAEPLRDLAAARGVGEKVKLLGPLDPERARAVIEQAAVLAMPSVVAPDGNRDAVPVVVLEALALEVPVVASAEAGLPEVVSSEWGRLVPPADPRALAAALGELLALPLAERAALGAAGRRFLLEHRDLDRQAEILLELIDQARAAELPPVARR